MDEQTRSSGEAHAVIAASMDGVGLLEGETFVSANEKLAASFGYEDADALVGTAWGELYPRAERERIEREALSGSRSEQGWRGEVDGIRSDGSTFSQSLSIRRTEDGRLVWIVRDHGEQAVFDQALDRGRQPDSDTTGDSERTVEPDHARDDRDDGNGERPTDQFRPQERGDSGMRPRPLVETAPVPVAVITADRGIAYCNARTVELLGADDRSDVIGQKPEQFVHPENRDRARQRIRRVLDEREATEPTEYRLLGMDDRKRFAEIAAAPLEFEGERGAYVLINNITRFRRAQEQIRQEREFLKTIIDEVDDIVYVLDAEGQPYLWNEALVETTGYSDEEIGSIRAKEFIPEEQREYVPGLMQAITSVEDRRVELDLLTKDGESIKHEFRGTTFENPATGEAFRCGITRDMTEWVERERQLEHQRNQLATLDRINQTLRETTRALIETGNRDAIERTVCLQLSDSELYQSAWVGELATGGDRFVPRTIVEDDHSFLDGIAIDIDADADEGDPAHRAIQTGKVQVVDRNRVMSTFWQDIASEYESESIAAVPLHHDGKVYGVLLIHTERKDGFNDREQDGFDVLGRTIGYVINAVKNHKLLFTDTVQQLEFRMTDTDNLFVNTAVRLGCELELDGYVASGQQWVIYFEIDGASVGDVIAAVADDSRVTRTRDISRTDDEGRIELTVTDSSLIHTVTRAGGVLRSATVSQDGTRFVVEAPVDADVREMVDAIRSDHPGVDLVAQRQRDHDISHIDRPGGMLEGLTDRQREVLEAAYRSGYFAWPRGSSAEEVAESLDIASPTLHGHLRKAEAAILSTLFDSR